MKQDFVLENMENTLYGHFPCLSHNGLVTHGFSTRMGGVSQGPYSTMNLAYNSLDDPRNVEENYHRFTSAMGVDWKKAVLTYQTHKSFIRRITEAETGMGLTRQRDYSDIDALITNEPGIPLMSFHADCAPLFLVDPIQKAVGLVHAGWRGTSENIAGKVVNEMNLAYGTKPEQITVGIGPCIQECCFLIRKDVRNTLLEKLPFVDGLMKKKNHAQWAVSLQMINRRLLLESGVSETKIHLSPFCTCCRHDLFYSHRSQGSLRGTMAALIQLNRRTD